MTRWIAGHNRALRWLERRTPALYSPVQRQARRRRAVHRMGIAAYKRLEANTRASPKLQLAMRKATLN